MAHEYCPVVGKERFTTRRDALRAVKNTVSRHKGEPSVYWCELCNSYHLTHYTYDHSKNVRSNPDYLILQKKPKKRKPKMKIIIDNAYVTDGAYVGVKKLNDGGEHLQLIVYDENEKSIEVQFTYEQGLELVEAIKIQIGKMKITTK